jgi:biopolymer transport protein ExbD
MIFYLLKSAACLLILLLVHQFLLQRESMHRFNRFFLLFSIVVSFLIPIYIIEVAAIPVAAESGGFEILENIVQAEYPEININSESIPAVKDLDFREEKSIPWMTIFWSVYLSLTLVFLIRFIRNIHLLTNKISRNLQVSYRGETLVLLAENSLPFTFLKYIFVSKTYFEEGKLTESIFAHERAHLQEKHSLDLLFIELLLVFFWFHPGLYFARQAIKLNHEFIADQAALQATTLERYQSQLLSMMVSGQNYKLASSLNFSLTKKRFEMMRRKTANSTKWIKIFSVIPVLAALVYFFSEKVTAQAEPDKESGVVVNKAEASKENEIQIHIRADGKIEVDGQIIEVEELAGLIDSGKNENMIARISAFPGVEMGFVADVQEILREKDVRRVVYQSQTTSEQDSKVEDERAEYFRNAVFLIEDENMEYTRKTYLQLSEAEKKGLFEPMKSPEKKSSDPEMFEDWKNKEKFALWLDDMVVSNDVLEDLNPSDIAVFWGSSVTVNARTKRFPQPYQFHLYSEEGYEKLLGPNSDFGKPISDTITLTQRNTTWHKDISRYPDPTTAYLQKNARYEKLRKPEGTFSQKSPEKQKELNQLYQELNEEYSKSSDKRKKSLKQPIPPQTKSESQLSVSANSEIHQTSLPSYQEFKTAYQLKVNESGLFAKKSDLEIEKLFEMFTILQDQYMFLSFEDKRKVQRPAFPYFRLEKDGKEIFKRFEDLTEEERKTLNC